MVPGPAALKLERQALRPRGLTGSQTLRGAWLSVPSMCPRPEAGGARGQRAERSEDNAEGKVRAG